MDNQMDKSQEVLEYKGSKYRVDALSQEGQHAYFQLKDVRQQMSELQFKHSQLDMAGKGYNSVLETSLAEHIESQNPSQKEDEACDVTEAPCEVDTSVVTEDVPEKGPVAPEEACDAICESVQEVKESSDELIKQEEAEAATEEVLPPV